MVKKRVSVSDLLQEEAQKFTPNDGESAIEVTAQPVTEENVAAEEAPTQAPETGTTARRTVPTKADLEATIKELKESLEQSQQQEASLQKQVADLQSSVSEQKTVVKRLTKELDEAKKAALHLAESNSQLIEEIKSLKQEKENIAASNSQLTEEITALTKPKETYKPVKHTYNQDHYRKSYRTSEHLATTQPDESEDTSSQMWLLD
ncbi:hypothetical protein H6G41_17755 [Tolypothrix sp. FACHB-123]|uniref:hypothetical protein n=1 Tax=Tolypothrix sp. FACHB-123 TaxID=2692868 RepID=UPI001688050C|nr:hypothetical protein [Tolypothrix sp. FACHB-123]MBD2356448.1 hypothetical protein [Tolypothrix sp. FACHB-123]